MNKNWVGGNSVVGFLALLASAALVLSIYSFQMLNSQKSVLDNTISIDASSSQLRVWTGGEWKDIGAAKQGQVLGVVDGQPGWIGSDAGSQNDSFAKAIIAGGLVKSTDTSGVVSVGLIGCESGQVLQSDGSSWQCGTIAPALQPEPATVYVAGTGVSISGVNVISALLGTSVGASELESGAVTGNALATNSVGSATIINGSLLLEDLSDNGCNPGQILKYNGSAWACASDDAGAGAYSFTVGDGTNTQLIDNSDLLRFSSPGTLSIVVSATDQITFDIANDAITSGKILNGTIGFNDIGANGCANGQIFKYNGSSWSCGTDNVNDADANATNELQDLSLGVNILSLSGSASTVNLAGYLDNTDSQNLSYVAGTQTLSIGGGNSVSLASLLDNTDAQAISRSGNTVSITGNAGTVDLSPYLDNTDALASLSCSNGQVAQWNGSAWVCASASVNTDSQTLSLITDTLSITGGNSVSLGAYLDNTDGQAISRSGNTISITGNAGTVDLSPYLDNTDVLAGLSCSNTQIAKYNGSAWVCAADNVNDADANATNELQDLSLSVNVLSLSGSAPTINLAGYLDNTDAQAISKTGDTLSISGNAGTVDLSGYLDNTDVLGSLSCGNTQIAKYNGSAWVCAADNDTDTTYSAGTGLTLTGTTFSSDLGADISSGEIVNGTILFADLSSNGCSNTEIFKYNGSAWVCGTDNVNDADANATNELQDLSLSVNVLSLSSSAPTINLAGYLDNTDSQNLSYVAGTQALSIGGGNSVSLSSLLDNTDAQAISKTGDTLSITGNAGTVDLSGYLDNTDVLGSLSCSNTQIAKYNGSAWVCAADNVNDADASATNELQDLGISTNTLTLTGSGATVDLSPYLDNTDTQAISRSGNTISITGNAGTVDLSPYLDNTDSQNLSYVAGTQTLSIGGGNSVSLASLLDNTDAQSISKTGDTLSISGNAGTVNLSGYLDNTDVLAGLSCSNTQIAKYNGSAWVCAADNVNDADANATNELQDLSLSVNVLSLSSSAPTVDLSGYLDNTDSQTVTYTPATQVLSISGGNTANLSSLLDNTDAQAISKTGDTLSISGNAGTVDLSGYLDNTDVLGSLSCSNTQIAKYNGSAWVCAADNDTDTTYSAGTGLTLTGTTFSNDLGTDIATGEILNGTILFADLASNSCGNNDIFKYNGSAWYCGTDVDTDTDTTYSQGTGISFAGTVISATLGTAIDSSEITDGAVSNTDLTNSSVTVTAGTGLTGGGAVSLGGTVTLNSALGTDVDTSEITNGTLLFADIASNGCGNNNIFKYNGSAWICGTDVDTDTTYSAGTGISFGGTVISSTLGTDIDSTEIVNGTIAAGDVAANTFAQLGIAAAQTDTTTNGLLFINKTGVSGNLLQLQVAGVDEFLVAYDGTIDTASVDSASIVDASIANGDLVSSSLTVTAGNGLTTGGSVSLGGTTTLNIGAGNGISVNTDDITIDATTTGTTAVTTSNSGLEVTAAGIRLLGGCADTEILKWSVGGSAWGCATDDGDPIAADSLNFTELSDTLTLDAATTISAGANAFNINLDSTGDFAIQDNGTTVLSVLDDGTFLFKNSADSASSFVIQDLAGIDVFAIDTSNDRVYIGDPTADATGALLILDTKNTAGDPTGVNGAMYYNSNKGKFRCFENSEWRDCMTSSRTGYFYRNEMMGATSENELVYAVTGAGAANSATAITSVAGRPGVMQQATGTTATGNPRGISGAPNGILLGNSSLFSYETAVRVTTLSTGTERYSYRTGFIDSGTAESVDGCFFRYSDATIAGNWQGVCRSNSAETSCDTGIAVVATTWYRLNITVNAAGTNANFATDGTSRCNVAANIPTGAGRGTGIGLMMLKSIGTTTRTIDTDYIEVRAEVPNR